MAIRRGECVIHISEHHGDATPGSRWRIAVADIDAFHTALDPTYANARPQIIAQPWGSREVTLTDPFGNTAVFYTSD